MNTARTIEPDEKSPDYNAWHNHLRKAKEDIQRKEIGRRIDNAKSFEEKQMEVINGMFDMLLPNQRNVQNRIDELTEGGE